MKPRSYLLFTLCLIFFALGLADAGPRRPGARPPVIQRPVDSSSRPGSLNTNTQSNYHLNNAEPVNQVFDRPTIAAPGSKPIIQQSAPTAPKHLIGDPPTPASLQDLYDSPSGNNRRPGARPSITHKTKTPKHLIGDPPTFPDDLGTYLFSTYDEADLRDPLTGEIRLYTGDLYNTGSGFSGMSWQTVFNWNPATGIGRSVYWWVQRGCPNDPSTVDYYYYTPLPPTAPPTVTGTNPTSVTTNNASISSSFIDPRFQAQPGNPLTNVPSTQVLDAAVFPPSGQSRTPTSTGSSYITYSESSESPSLSATGRITAASNYSSENFVDGSAMPASVNIVRHAVQEVSPVANTNPVSMTSARTSGLDLWAGIAKPEAGNSTSGAWDGFLDLSPVGSSTAAWSTSGLNTGFCGGTLVDAPTDPGTRMASLQVTEFGNKSSSLSGGNATSANSWLWLLAALLLGGGTLEGMRRMMSWQPDAIWIEPTPPSPDQRERELKLEATREAYQLESEKAQTIIQYDTQAVQQGAQRAKEESDAILQQTLDMERIPTKIQQNKQKLDQNWQMVVAADNARTADLYKDPDNPDWERLPGPPGVAGDETAQAPAPSDSSDLSDLSDLIAACTVEDYMEPDYKPRHKLALLEDAASNEPADGPGDPVAEEMWEAGIEGWKFRAWVQDLGLESRSVAWENMDLQDEFDGDQRSIDAEQESIRSLQDEQINLAADIEQQQADLADAANEYQSALQEYGEPDLGSPWNQTGVSDQYSGLDPYNSSDETNVPVGTDVAALLRAFGITGDQSNSSDQADTPEPSDIANQLNNAANTILDSLLKAFGVPAALGLVAALTNALDQTNSNDAVPNTDSAPANIPDPIPDGNLDGGVLDPFSTGQDASPEAPPTPETPPDPAPIPDGNLDGSVVDPFSTGQDVAPETPPEIPTAPAPVPDGNLDGSVLNPFSSEPDKDSYKVGYGYGRSLTEPEAFKVLSELKGVDISGDPYLQGVLKGCNDQGRDTAGLGVLATTLALGAIAYAALVSLFGAGTEAATVGTADVALGQKALQEAEALVPEVEAEAQNAAAQANTLHHIFDKPMHALDGLVQQFGSQEKAFEAVQNAANQALQKGLLTPNAEGILPSGTAGNIIDVAGTQVQLIGGRVLNGVVQISSFSRYGL
jgi:hypothetical protein